MHARESLRRNSAARPGPAPRVGRAGGASEIEADRAADAVLAGRRPALASHPASPGHDPSAEPGAEAAAAAVASGGAPLAAGQRRAFEPLFGRDLSAVRVHSDDSAVSAARGIGARAYTFGNHIALTDEAAHPRILAHELAHVVQQDAGTTPDLIQRDIAADALPTTPAETIMADSNYFENGIERIEFFSAELARLHYAGGAKLDVGLVPEWIKPPFEAVDYRTARSEHLPIAPKGGGLGTGAIDFVPRVRSITAPPGASMEAVIQATKRTIGFAIEPGSGRIVPTEVNSISAPRLCAALRSAEAAYVQQFDAMAAGMVKTLEAFEWVILLSSLIGTGLAARASARAAAARTTAAAAGGATGRAAGKFAEIFSRFLRPGASKAAVQATVEGVGFGGVRATVQGSELVASYSHILNVGKVAGQGRLMHGALEAGAIQAARAAGLRSARVAVELVQNAKWAAHLESLGYGVEVITLPPSLFTRVYTKVFIL